MRSINQFQARNNVYDGEYNPGLSLTIPGQAITPQELLRRYATGQPLGFRNVEPIFDEEVEVPEFYKMNKLDRLHFLQNNSEKVQDLRSELKAYQRSEQAKQESLKKETQENAKITTTIKADSERSDSKAIKE